jgi:predicted acylesterase/phospholipase RssA
MHHDVGQQKQQQERGAVAIRIATLAQLEEHWQDQGGRFRDARTGEVNYNRLLRSASVMGDTQVIGSKDHPEYTHPVLKLLHERRRNRLRQQEQQHRYRPLPLSSTVVEDNADAGNDINGLGDVGVASSAACGEGDRCKIALAIEGGGMRGCISAGMVGAIHHLGLTDSFDVVYGSSAGTIVGAYLITGQLPWFGPEVYYDCLTTAGKGFIDTRRLLRSLGFGLLDPRLLKDVLTRPAGKPVLNLSYLLQTTLQGIKPVDWDKFVQRQADIPLKIVASGCRSERAVVLDMQNRAFESLPELADCMHASCLLPGIAGPLMNLDRRAIEDPSAFAAAPGSKKLQLGNNLQGDHLEPLADALLFEPLPFRSAVREGATHVLVLRSRPDGTDVTGKGGIFEQLIFRRFFLRKNRLPNMFKRLKMQLHKKVYAEGVIELNEAARDDRDYLDTSAPHLMTIALEPGSKEISRLETGRAAIFDGMRRGFARAYDCLVEDPSERGRGMIVAKEFFPDEILDYDPLEIEGGDLFESAFATYLRQKGITPRSWRERQDDAYCHKSGEVNEYRR